MGSHLCASPTNGEPACQMEQSGCGRYKKMPPRFQLVYPELQYCAPIFNMFKAVRAEDEIHRCVCEILDGVEAALAALRIYRRRPP